MLYKIGCDSFGPIFLFQSNGMWWRRIFFPRGGFYDRMWKGPASPMFFQPQFVVVSNKPQHKQPEEVKTATVQPEIVQASTKQEVKTSTSSTVDTWSPSTSGSSTPNFGPIWNWSLLIGDIVNN
jgi:hypothetical protein